MTTETLFGPLDDLIRMHPAWDNRLFQQFREKNPPFQNWPITDVVGPEYLYFTKAFPRILSKLIARIDEENLRFLLTGILYSELGSGNASHAHWKLYEQMLIDTGLPPRDVHRKPRFRQTERLVEELEAIYSEKDIAIALGAQYALEAQADNMLRQLHEGFLKVTAMQRTRQLPFFDVHQVEEPGHIAAMRKCIQEICKEHNRNLVEEGVQDCLGLFAEFWNAFVPHLVDRQDRAN